MCYLRVGVRRLPHFEYNVILEESQSILVLLLQNPVM